MLLQNSATAYTKQQHKQKTPLNNQQQSEESIHEPVTSQETPKQQEQQTNPPAVYMCEHRGLADIYELIASARISFLRGSVEVDWLPLKVSASYIGHDTQKCIGKALSLHEGFSRGTVGSFLCIASRMEHHCSSQRLSLASIALLSCCTSSYLS